MFLLEKITFLLCLLDAECYKLFNNIGFILIAIKIKEFLINNVILLF